MTERTTFAEAPASAAQRGPGPHRGRARPADVTPPPYQPFRCGPHTGPQPPFPERPPCYGRPTQMRSWARTTLPFRQARCSAVRPSTSPHVSFTSSREPCASSRMTARRSSSAVARSRCWPRDSSVHGSGARKSFCSYLARIQRSFSSLQEPTTGGGHRRAGRDPVPLAVGPGGSAAAGDKGLHQGGEAPGKASPLVRTAGSPPSSLSATWEPVRNASSQAPCMEPLGWWWWW